MASQARCGNRKCQHCDSSLLPVDIAGFTLLRNRRDADRMVTEHVAKVFSTIVEVDFAWLTQILSLKELAIDHLLTLTTIELANAIKSVAPQLQLLCLAVARPEDSPMAIHGSNWGGFKLQVFPPTDHDGICKHVLPHCHNLTALYLDDRTVHPAIILDVPTLRHLHLVVPYESPIDEVLELFERFDTAVQTLVIDEYPLYPELSERFEQRLAYIGIKYANVDQRDPAAFMRQHSTVFRPPQLL